MHGRPREGRWGCLNSEMLGYVMLSPINKLSPPNCSQTGCDAYIEGGVLHWTCANTWPDVVFAYHPDKATTNEINSTLLAGLCLTRNTCQVTQGNVHAVSYFGAQPIIDDFNLSRSWHQAKRFDIGNKLNGQEKIEETGGVYLRHDGSDKVLFNLAPPDRAGDRAQALIRSIKH